MEKLAKKGQSKGVFHGRFVHTIDAKGRVSIPAKFREVLKKKYDERLMVTNYERCLIAYPITEWEVLEAKILGQPSMKREIKAFMRFFYSSAVECSLDRQGRILIPPTLRDYAKLEKDVISIGTQTKFEIWSRVNWAEEESRAEQQFQEGSEALAELGI